MRSIEHGGESRHIETKASRSRSCYNGDSTTKFCLEETAGTPSAAAGTNGLAPLYYKYLPIRMFKYIKVYSLYLLHSTYACDTRDRSEHAEDEVMLEKLHGNDSCEDGDNSIDVHM